MKARADIGLVGLAVMGENLILNMESKGFTVACFNRTTSKMDDFINGRAAGKNIIGCHTVDEFIGNLKRPRKVMCMIKAGEAVDAFIESVRPYLEAGDIIIDGGNSNYFDTIRRVEAVEGKGLLYVGAGISGGEEGALLGLSNEAMADVFAEWNKGLLDSYLIEITRDILAYRDENNDTVLDRILDTAGQKGTGKWTAINALDVGQPLTLIGEAVFTRCLSALKDERVAAAQVLKGPQASFKGDREAMIDDLEQALYASKIVSYAQGYQLLRAMATEQGWDLNYGGIALMWRGGCIIRSAFLGKIKEAFDADAGLANLLLAPFFRQALETAQDGWRRVAATAVQLGIPMPAISSALAYYDGYRSKRLPANLLQAQRDYFGAHTYERVDRSRGEFFHTNWTGSGGNTASSTYEA